MKNQMDTQPSLKQENIPLQTYTLPAEDVLAALETSVHGLSESEVQLRLMRFGPNILPEPGSLSVFQLFLSQFLSPLIYVLFAAAVISLFLAEYADAGFIAAVLLINAIIGTTQEFHAQRSAETLRNLISATAVVMREGESLEIDASQLVVGDIVLLESGDKVPADLRLIHEFDLEIDESLLTGESLAVSKDATATLESEGALGDRINMAYSGSLVNRGRGRGVVIATGEATEVGHLAESLQDDTTKPPLILRMEKFTMGITIALGFVVLALAGVEYYNGTEWHEIFMISVALAVSAIPEGLPVALTVALAIGMNRMSKRNVIVRRLVAVEALGSCTVIASDKTGTLTMNQLTAKEIGLPSQDYYQITGASNTPEGTVKSLADPIDEHSHNQLQDLARAAVLCNEGFFGKRGEEWVSHGDAVDVALLVMGHKMGLSQAEAQQTYPLIASIPYESEFGYAATLHALDDNNYLILVKGALERLMPMCQDMSGKHESSPLNQPLLETQMETMAHEGFRALAFAHAILPKSQDIADFGREDLTGLSLLGLVGMIDPLRSEAKAAVQACHQAGIRACMITGDHPATAFAIAHKINLVEHPEQVVTGNQLRETAKLGQEALLELVANANVFARVEPSQKVDIVKLLQASGHFVAVTGDGANDAPALIASHVGIAMGKRGTDVAKECADLVIADDNFSSIVAGVEEGRVAYQNIRKVIFLLISTGAAELVLFFLSLLSGLPLPLTAVQLLWLNLVTNGIQDVALAFEPREGNEMKRPPRNPQEPIFNRIMLERVLISALMIGVLAFLTFQSLLNAGMNTDEARNSTLLLMVLFENVHAFNSRSETRSVFYHNPFANPLLFYGIIIAQAVHIATMYIPGLNNILGMQPVSLSHWFQLLLIAMVILFTMEAHKWVRHTWPVQTKS